MAVPPADDGTVAVVDTSPRASSRLTILSAVLAVVIVACLGVLTYRYVADTEGSSVGNRVGQLFGADAADAVAPDDARARELLLSQANQFMLRINTYGPGDLDAANTLPTYTDRVHEVITDKFTASFDENVTLAEQTVAQAGYARSAQLFSSGVESMDEDSASVLVAGVINGSYPDPDKGSGKDGGRIEYEPQPFRVAVSLVLVDGTWLVDDFAPVTDGTGDAGATDGPAGLPTDVPTDVPTGQPTGTPRSGATP